MRSSKPAVDNFLKERRCFPDYFALGIQHFQELACQQARGRYSNALYITLYFLPGSHVLL